jgi:hypothetical protein
MRDISPIQSTLLYVITKIIHLSYPYIHLQNVSIRTPVHNKLAPTRFSYISKRLVWPQLYRPAYQQEGIHGMYAYSMNKQ